MTPQSRRQVRAGGFIAARQWFSGSKYQTISTLRTIAQWPWKPRNTKEFSSDMKIFNTLFAACLLATAGLALATPFWGAKAPVPFDTPSESLRNGEFTWAPEIAPGGPIAVLVSLDEQRAYTYRNGILIGKSTVSTGKPGHETPTGVFATTFKDKNHHSSIYHNAAMPYTERFTNDGVALHAGGIPGYPESHGCVHLPSEFARLLFEAAPVGMTVVVANSATQPQFVDHPAFLSPITDKGQLAANRRLFADEPFRWEPEKSDSGPLAMVVSRYDGRMVVLRNGVEIGRVKVQFINPDKPVGTHVFVAREPVANKPKWIGVGVVGHMDDANTSPDPEVVKDLQVPHDFVALVTPLVDTGTTLIVTDAAIMEHTTGKEMAVISSNPEV